MLEYLDLWVESPASASNGERVDPDKLLQPILDSESLDVDLQARAG